MKNYTYLLLGILLLTSVTALEFDNTVFEKTLSKTVTYNKIYDTYKPLEIINAYGLGEKLADVSLEKHDFTCGNECSSELMISITNDVPLVDDIKFYTVTPKGLVEEKIRSYNIYYWGTEEVTVKNCSDTIKARTNSTYFYSCPEITTTSKEKWISYPLGKSMVSGTYSLRIEGVKAPYKSVDWIIKTQGKTLDSLATWGNISTGSQAQVNLLSPTDASTQFVRLISLNSSADITTGATLVNTTLFDNSTGTWGARNSSSSVGATQAHGVAMGTSTTTPILGRGMNITVGATSVNLVNITKDSRSSTNGTAVLYASTSCTLLASATFSGNTATFSPPPLLSANTKYAVMMWSAAGPSAVITFAGTTYPRVNTYLNWTKGMFAGCATQNDEVNDIESIGVSVGGNVSTANFTNNYSSAQSYLWNYKYCDSDGACGFAPNNFTFFIDGNAPNITVTIPATVTDTGTLGSTLQLSYTATDAANLDKCWYSYNATNSTPVSCTSGVANTPTITLTTRKNITFYANDTLNNLNSTTKVFDYKVFINSATYNATTDQGTTESFIINVTANNSLTAANLVYGGTTYPMTNLTDGRFNVTIDIPTGFTGVQQFYFSFTYNGGTIVSSNLTQTVSQVYFTVCNDTYNTPYLRINYKDETNQSSITALTDLASAVYYVGTGTTTSTYLYSNSTQNGSTTFCFSPPTKTVITRMTYKYSGNGYPLRTYVFTNQSLTNTTTTQTLYMLSSNDGLYSAIQVVDEVTAPIAGAVILVERQVAGVWVTIGQDTTGDDGIATFWVNPNFAHRVTVTATGYTTNQVSITPSQATYTIQLSNPDGQITNYYQGIVNQITPSQNFLDNNTAYNFSYTLNSSYWTVTEYGFKLYYSNNHSLLRIDNDTTNGGIITFTNVNVSGNGIYARYYYVVNNTTVNSGAARDWYLQSTQGREYSIKRFLTDMVTYMDAGLLGIDDFARILISVTVLVLTVGMLSMRYGLNNDAALMGIIFGLVLFLDIGVGILPDFAVGDRIAIPHFITYLTAIVMIAFILREELQ